VSRWFPGVPVTKREAVRIAGRKSPWAGVSNILPLGRNPSFVKLHGAGAFDRISMAGKKA